MAKLVEFEGKQFEFPDDASDQEIGTALGGSTPKTLFSREGISSTINSIGPNIAKGILGSQLAGLEELQNARDFKRSQDPSIPDDDAGARAQIEEKKRAIQEASFDLNEIQGEQSLPLSIANSVVNSVAQNAPGVGAAILLRDKAGIAAAAPGLQSAYDLTKGQTYAESRVDKKGSVEDSLANANVQGMTEAAFEFLPTKYIIDKLGNEGFFKFVKEYMLKEWGTEIPTTIAQDVSDWATVDKDKPVGDFLHDTFKDVLQTAAVVPFAAGMTGAGAHAIHKAGQFDIENPLGLPDVVNGVDNSQLSAPSTAPTQEQKEAQVFLDEFSKALPTVELDSTQQSDVQAMISSIDASLLDDEAVKQAQATVQAHKDAQKAPPIAGASDAWGVLDSVAKLDDGADLGASQKQVANAANYVNPNNDPRIERTFLLGPEEAVGLTPQQHLPEKSTYVLGVPSEDRSQEYLEKLHTTVEGIRQKYLPNSTIVISNEELPFDNALGWHSSRNGVHIIIPAALRNMKDVNTFNPHTLRGAFYTLTHEVGHAIVNDRFFEGIEGLTQETLRNESSQGIVSEAIIAALPAEQQAIVKEYNFLKQQVIDGTMSAGDFVNKWMGPGKASRKNILEGVDPLGPATAIINRIAGNAARSARSKNAGVNYEATRKKVAADLLSIDEYLAEQMARHAYKAKWDQATPLGQWFKRALDSLRAFFTEQKRDGLIGPGTAFAEWVEGLTLGERVEEPAKQKALSKKAKAPNLQRAPKAAKTNKKPEVQRTQLNVETSTHPAKQKQGKELLASLLNEGKLSEDSPDVLKMLQLLRTKDYDEFVDLYKKHSGKEVKFELKPEGGNWTEESVDFIASPILDGNNPELQVSSDFVEWGRKLARNYLQKWAATAKDPLKDIEIPGEDGRTTWGEAWKKSISALPRWLTEQVEESLPNPKAPREEPTYRFRWSDQSNGQVRPGILAGAPHFQPTGFEHEESINAQEDVIGYLAHAHDYLVQNVPQTEWQKYDMVRLIKETAAWDKELAKNMAKKRGEEKTKSPVLKEYPDGFYWQQLTMPGQFARESDAMGHSVRGYEPEGPSDHGVPAFKDLPAAAAHPDWVPESGTAGNQYYGLGGWEAIKSGQAQVFSLRDPAGNSHVTIEVGKSTASGGGVGWDNPNITQIKGKQNEAPKKEYLPYVQDFVRSGQWDEVGDIRNTGLVDITTLPSSLQESVGSQFPGQKFITQQEYDTAVYGKPQPPRGNFDLDDTPEQTQFLKGIRNFMSDAKPLRMALRRAQGIAYWALEIQQLAHLNPDLSDLASFVHFNTEYNSRKASLQARPDQLADEWQRLNKEDFDKVNKVLLEEMEGGEHWFELTKSQKQRGSSIDKWSEFQMSPRAMDELLKRGIDITEENGKKLAKLVLDVKNDLLDKLNEKEQTILGLVAQRHAGDGPTVLTAAFIPVMKKFQDYRKKPFFPQGRFGNLMLIIEKHNPQGGYDVVYREAFENREDWKKAHAAAFKNAKVDERVKVRELTDQTYVMLSLPLDFVDTAASALDLTEDEVEILLNVLQPVRTERALKAYDLNRLGIKGYSTDALRSYANFTWHDANLIAKMEYRAKFGLAIRGISKKLREASMQGPGMEDEVFRLGRTKQAMEQTRDYIMSPPNEAQMLRGTVAVGYLALNLKTALVNFFGLVTTWSDMTRRLGLVDGSTVMAKATKKGLASIRLNPKHLNERREGDYMTKDEQGAMDKALSEGVLSQSYAYHLAGVANRSQLFRNPTQKAIGRYAKEAVDLSMYAFRLTELSTRRVSFLAEFEQAKRQPGLTNEEAYNQAVQKTNLLQNDYSLGNRVPFMRGTKLADNHPLKNIVEPAIPLATIFMSFVQHMAFHTYGGYELGERRAEKLVGESPRSIMGGYTMKLWIVLLMIAGYEGLPGAENILDLLDIAWRKFGGNKPARQEIREVVKGLDLQGLDPQFAAHGLGHNIGGFDISRSVGMGRIVPGTDTVKSGNNFDETAGALTIDLLGPLGGYIKWGLGAAFDNDYSMERLAKVPGGIGNILTAYNWSQEGVRAPTGALVTHDPATGKLRDLTAVEIFGKALGFNPTAVSESREIRWSQYDRKVYWQSRRKELLDNLWETKWQKDKGAEADAKKSIADFNTSIPPEYKAIRISGKDIAGSIKQREHNKELDEARRPSEKRYRGLYDDVLESYQ